MVNSYTVFNLFLGTLTLIGVIFSAVTWCRNYLPSTQLAVFDKIFLETKEVFECAKCDNLLVDIRLQTIIHQRFSEFVGILRHTSKDAEFPIGLS